MLLHPPGITLSSSSTEPSSVSRPMEPALFCKCCGWFPPLTSLHFLGPGLSAPAPMHISLAPLYFTWDGTENVPVSEGVDAPLGTSDLDGQGNPWVAGRNCPGGEIQAVATSHTQERALPRLRALCQIPRVGVGLGDEIVHCSWRPDLIHMTPPPYL